MIGAKKTYPNYSESIYSGKEIDELISQGYVPVATDDELAYVGQYNNQTHKFGVGTPWEGDYKGGYDKKYVQVKDIDLTFFKEAIGGTGNRSFKGIFDGGGFTLDRLYLSSSGDYVGLFRSTGAEAIIRNVSLINPSVRGQNNVGALVGDNGGTIENCYVRATGPSDSYSIIGESSVGGLVGDNGRPQGHIVGGRISNSYTDITVNAYKLNAGGLVGSSSVGNNERIVNSYAVGKVRSNHPDRKGGLIGYAGSQGFVTNSYYSKSGTGLKQSAGGIGKDDYLMKRVDLYSGWDTSIWNIVDGEYPTFQWE